MVIKHMFTVHTQSHKSLIKKADKDIKPNHRWSHSIKLNCKLVNRVLLSAQWALRQNRRPLATTQTDGAEDECDDVLLCDGRRYSLHACSQGQGYGEESDLNEIGIKMS